MKMIREVVMSTQGTIYSDSVPLLYALSKDSEWARHFCSTMLKLPPTLPNCARHAHAAPTMLTLTPIMLKLHPPCSRCTYNAHATPTMLKLHPLSSLCGCRRGGQVPPGSAPGGCHLSGPGRLPLLHCVWAGAPFHTPYALSTHHTVHASRIHALGWVLHLHAAGSLHLLDSSYLPLPHGMRPDAPVQTHAHVGKHTPLGQTHAHGGAPGKS